MQGYAGGVQQTRRDHGPRTGLSTDARLDMYVPGVSTPRRGLPHPQLLPVVARDTRGHAWWDVQVPGARRSGGWVGELLKVHLVLHELLLEGTGTRSILFFTHVEGLKVLNESKASLKDSLPMCGHANTTAITGHGGRSPGGLVHFVVDEVDGVEDGEPTTVTLVSSSFVELHQPSWRWSCRCRTRSWHCWPCTRTGSRCARRPWSPAQASSSGTVPNSRKSLAVSASVSLPSAAMPSSVATGRDDSYPIRVASLCRTNSSSALVAYTKLVTR